MALRATTLDGYRRPGDARAAVTAREFPDGAHRVGLRHSMSRRRLQRILGALWLLDGLLQLQPSMFTSNLIHGIMQPATQGQPALLAATLQPLIDLTSRHLVMINSMIALVQLMLGISLVSGRLVRPALLLSVAWSFGVWYGGEGMGMLLTGQASALTGAPGAVLLYALLAVAAYPATYTSGLVTRRQIQRVLAGFWALAALLQMQPYWWQSHQISNAITAMEGEGTLNGTILAPSLRWLAHMSAGAETALNITVVVIALGLALGLAVTRHADSRPFLLASTAMSLLLWWVTEGFGQIFTGTATDLNSGPLLIVIALVCWPASPAQRREHATGAPAGEYVPKGLLLS